jgi:hypothetical protein
MARPRKPKKPAKKKAAPKIAEWLRDHLPRPSSSWTLPETKQLLADAEAAARAADDPIVYLDRLRAIHKDWHSSSPHSIGFLTFHYWVLKHFVALGLDRKLGDRDYNNPMSEIIPTRLVGVRQYHPDDFANGGHIGGGVPPALAMHVSTADDLMVFSHAFEDWHNFAHWHIGQATDCHQMMEPTLNIYMPPFWKLHFFINNNFIGKLLGYALAEGLISPTTSPDRWVEMSKDFIVTHLEAAGHGAHI